VPTPLTNSALPTKMSATRETKQHPVTRLLRATLLSVGVVLACLFVIEASAYVATGTSPISRPEEVLAPAGFRGWIVVDYGHPECPPSGADGLATVFEVPPTGQICTSAPEPTGWHSTTVYLVASDGQKNALHFSSSDQPGFVWGLVGANGEHRLIYFVGSEAEFNAAQSQPDRPR
jgi:hypothetical protein